jgi:hypothetical protein
MVNGQCISGMMVNVPTITAIQYDPLLAYFNWYKVHTGENTHFIPPQHLTQLPYNVGDKLWCLNEIEQWAITINVTILAQMTDNSWKICFPQGGKAEFNEWLDLQVRGTKVTIDKSLPEREVRDWLASEISGRHTFIHHHNSALAYFQNQLEATHFKMRWWGEDDVVAG